MCPSWDGVVNEKKSRRSPRHDQIQTVTRLSRGRKTEVKEMETQIEFFVAGCRILIVAKIHPYSGDVYLPRFLLKSDQIKVG